MFILMLKILIDNEEYSIFSAIIVSIFMIHTAVSQQKKALEAESNIILRDRISHTPALSLIICAMATSTKKFANTLCSKYKILIYLENW